jgi:hypothetical protein
VATPGRQLAPQRTEFEDFRDAVITAGRGVAQAATASASIKSRLRSLKEQSVAEVEADLNRAARHLQVRRLERADRQRQEILVEAKTRGVEWAERKLRHAMLNSSSTQEARLWEGAWREANSAIERENAEAEQQEFNAAARQIETVGLALNQQIAENPELKAELVGNGVGIAERVQDYLIAEASAANPALFETPSKQRDILVHQLMKQAFRIADDLTRDYTEEVEKSNRILGGQQIEADVFATLTGENEPGKLRTQIETTMRDRLGSLPLEQQNEAARQIIEAQIQTLADGGYGLEALGGFDGLSEVLDMALNGQPLFSPEDRRRILVNAAERAVKTADRSMEAEIQREARALDEPLRLPDGTVVMRPNPAALGIITQPDPETGLSRVDEAANRILADMGLLKPSLTPEESLIVGAVRASAAKVTAQAQKANADRVEAVVNFNAVMTGQPGANANKAYDFSPERRAYLSPAGLQANEQPPLSAMEVAFLKENLKDVARAIGGDPTAVDAWDGSTLTYSDENREINRLMAVYGSRRWSEDKVQDAHGMPDHLVEEKLALLRSSDPNRRRVFTQFVLNMERGNNASLDNFMNSGKLSEQEKAATQWLRVHARLGATGFDQEGNLRNNRLEPQLDQLAAGVDNILTAQPVTTWMGSDVATEDSDRSKAGRMAEVMSEIIMDRVEGADFDTDAFGSKLSSQLREAFLGDGNQAAQFIRRMWFAGRQASPELTEEQIGAQIYSWMEIEGYRPRSVNGEFRFIVDPQGYTGEPGEEITEFVDRQWTREFTPEYRDFLQRAMGLKPSEAPINLQDLMARANPFQIVGSPEQRREPGAVLPTFTFNEQITDRILDSRSNYGGFVVSGTSPQSGERLALPVAREDTELRWPDGTTVVVPKGAVLSVINPDLFRPTRKEVEPLSLFTPNPTGAFGAAGLAVQGSPLGGGVGRERLAGVPAQPGQ